MKPRIRLLLAWWVGCCVCLGISNRLSAETAFRAVEPGVADVSGILQDGLQLEHQERWGEALTHYEAATRRHPGNSQLQSRMTLARIHFDLDRRYADASYLSAMRQLPPTESLDLLGEVLLKIQSHYVHEPDWNALLGHGTECMRVALRDEEFAKEHRLPADTKAVQAAFDVVAQGFQQRRVRDRHQAQEMVRWSASVMERRLRIPVNATIMEYMCGMAGALDPYSTYLTAEQLDEVFSQIEGNFVGLGIELKAESDSLLIANVISHGPADRAGMRAGERIIAVDGTSTREVAPDAVADLLKGEEGSFVEVVLQDVDQHPRSLRIRRERVEVPSVEDVKIVDPSAGVGYFKISSFQKTTSRDVDAALWELHRNGMRTLIVDVRGNPGGLLNEAVEVADRFLEEGTIVATHGRSARENYDYKAHSVGTWRMPLLVLIDGDSASASEIFAGAIHDHQRGLILGDRSYGKGSVQGIFPLRNAKSGVRLTTAKFYSPSGHAISQGGVEPDEFIRTTAKPVTEGESKISKSDPVLEVATQRARQWVARRDANPQERSDRATQPAAAARIGGGNAAASR